MHAPCTWIGTDLLVQLVIRFADMSRPTFGSSFSISRAILLPTHLSSWNEISMKGLLYSRCKHLPEISHAGECLHCIPVLLPAREKKGFRFTITKRLKFSDSGAGPRNDESDILALSFLLSPPPRPCS